MIDGQWQRNKTQPSVFLRDVELSTICSYIWPSVNYLGETSDNRLNEKYVGKWLSTSYNLFKKSALIIKLRISLTSLKYTELWHYLLFGHV